MKAQVMLLASVLALAGSGAAIANDTGFAQSTHTTRREGGKLCIVGHTHGGEGSGGTKSVALTGAINAFVVTTVDEYGSDWDRPWIRQLTIDDIQKQEGKEK